MYHHRVVFLILFFFSSMPSERYMKRRKKKAKFVAITCIYSVIICSHGISINFACLASRSIFISFFFLFVLNICVHSMHKWAYGLLFCGPANKIRIKKKKYNKITQSNNEMYVISLQKAKTSWNRKMIFNWLVTITIFSSNCFKLARSTR